MTKVHTLNNGVRVICDAAAGYETFALSVVAGRGARFEPEDRSGWSHLLEHMVFKGAGERSSRDIVEDIESEGGSINAQTSYERTSFQVRGLAGSLPLAVQTLGDLVMRPTLDAEELVREKQVVAQEIAESVDTPDDHVFEQAQATAYRGHALGRPVLGLPSTLEPADPANLRAWRDTLYAPDRLVISAAGAVDEDELLQLAEAAFADAKGEGPAGGMAPLFEGGSVATRRKLEQAHLVFMMPAVGSNDEAVFALRLMAEALGGGMSSRLFQEAREKLGLAYAIDAFAETYIDAGFLGVYAGCDAEDAGALAKVTAQELRKLSEGIGDKELSRCKAQLKAVIFMSKESMTARAEHAAAQLLTYGEIRTVQDFARRIDAVTRDDIAAMAGGIIASRKSAISTLGPAKSRQAATTFDKVLFA